MILLNSTEWKCFSCGAEINPGDQICRHCGNKIHNTKVSIEDLRTHENGRQNENKKSHSFLIFSILSVVLVVAIIFLIIWFGILKR
ncbi:MAG: zinc ribbon domain-containing protein [Bacilli bacterium]|nr:zinc ribbon domain-containing protein [Bacilli bacterium]